MNFNNGAYCLLQDPNLNGHGSFNIVNGYVKFHCTPVTYESLQEQNYWLTNMVMQNYYLENCTNYYYPIINDTQVVHKNEVVKRRKTEPVPINHEIPQKPFITDSKNKKNDTLNNVLQTAVNNVEIETKSGNK